MFQGQSFFLVVRIIMACLTMDGILNLIKYGSRMPSGSTGFSFFLELLDPYFSQHSWFNVSAPHS